MKNRNEDSMVETEYGPPRSGLRAALHATRGSTRRALLVGAPLLAALVAAGCGNLVAGGATGEASVAVSGDAGDSSEGSAAEPFTEISPAGRADGSIEIATAVEGTLDVRFKLFLDAEGGGSVPLSQDEIHVQVDLSGDDEPEVADHEVPAGRYDGLRMVFTEITADVESGLDLQDALLGIVRVEIEGPTLTVLRPLDVEIDEGGRVDLLIDLNSATWLLNADPVEGLVPQAAFADAVDVRTR